MIVDSSVIVAILAGEKQAQAFAEALAQAPFRHISAANYVETAIVVDSRADPIFSRSLEDLIRDARIIIESVTPEQARLAREACSTFGRCRHRAGLNFGDCFAYALAKDKGEPLLFKGGDFAHTDITPALTHG